MRSRALTAVAPEKFDAPVSVTDEASKAALGVALVHTATSAAEIADGYVVHQDALGTGAHLFRRPSAEGYEDFFALPLSSFSPVS